MKVREYDADPSQSGTSHVGTEQLIRSDVVYGREYVITSENGFGVVSPSSSFPSSTWRGQSPLQNPEKRSAVVFLWDFGRYYLTVAPRRIFVDLFLPVGYPNSVGEAYLQYQICDSIQGLCSYLRGVVSTSAVLTAAGVGDAEATAMSAAVAWATKDGLGMVGGLLFSYCASSQFDSHVKEFRLFADVINDVGLTLDMVAPYIGRGRVLYVSSVATVCRVMCGMAAGATKGSITQHFALRGNMADLNAKESTQETLVSLMGMLMGIALARYLHRLEQDSTDHDDAGGSRFLGNTASRVSWIIFIILTVVHVWVNYLGVKVLRLRTLNRERATVAFSGLIDACVADCLKVFNRKGETLTVGSTPNESLLKSIPGPDGVSESLWSSTTKLLFSGNVRLGTTFNDSFRGLTSDEMLRYLDEEFCSEHYILTIVGGHGHRALASAKVCVMLRVGAGDRDEMKAFLHALVLRGFLDLMDRGYLSDSQNRRQLIAITHRRVNLLFGDDNSVSSPINKHHGSRDTGDPIFSLDVLSSLGWDVKSRLYLGFGRWRVQWDDKKSD